MRLVPTSIVAVALGACGGEEPAPLPEPIEIAWPDHIAVRDVPGGTGGREALVVCPSLGAEPALGLGVEAQPDVPDSGLTSYIPPNTSGGVGPRHLVTHMQNEVRILDRLGVLVSNVDLLAFWSPLGATATTFPRVSYDSLSDRWIATVRYGAMRDNVLSLTVVEMSPLPFGVKLEIVTVAVCGVGLAESCNVNTASLVNPE